MPWRGHHLKRGLVAYCLAEGTAFFSHRVTTAFDAIGINAEDQPFYTMPSSLNLMSGKGGVVTDDVKQLIEKIKLVEIESGHQTRLVVFDTLSRYMPAGDENNQEDASALIHGCEYIREQLGSAIMLLHHLRKDQNQVRGSTVLTAAVDEVITNKMWGEKFTDGPVLWTTATENGKRKDREDANEWTQAKMEYMSDGGLYIMHLPDANEETIHADDIDEHLFRDSEDEYKMMPVIDLIDEPTDPQSTTKLSADADRMLKTLQNEGPLGIRPLMRKLSMSQNKLYKILDVLMARGLIEKGTGKDKRYSASGSSNPFGG
jgi:predicted transcriptional regulator